MFMQIGQSKLLPISDANFCSDGVQPTGNAQQDEPAQVVTSHSAICVPVPGDKDERQVIEATVAQVFGVEGRALRGVTRGRAKIAHARQVAMYLAHVACGMSLTEVGRTFARDRTTVSHACGVIEDGRDDPTFDRVLELLEQVVRALLRPRDRAWSATGEWLLQ